MTTYGFEEDRSKVKVLPAVEIDSKLANGAKAFANVAAMKAANNLKQGDICHTDGFHASGDGGAAWYEITDAGTANEMDVIACGNLFANLIIEKEYNVKQFGAIADGSTDAYPYFARTIARMFEDNPLTAIIRDNPSGGGVVFIPNGDYMFDTPLTESNFYSNVTFKGENKDSVRIKCATNFVKFDRSSISVSDQWREYSGWNINYYNITFFSSTNAINMLGVQNCTFSNCKFSNISDQCVLLYLFVGIVFEKCYFVSSGYGIYAASAGVGPCTTLEVNECWFNHCTIGFTAAFSNINALHTSIIHNSIFEYCSVGMSINGNTTSNYRTRLAVENIHFEQNTSYDLEVRNASIYAKNAEPDGIGKVFLLNNSDLYLVEFVMRTVDLSKFNIQNRLTNKFILRGNDGTLYDNINRKLVVHTNTAVLDSYMIATEGNVFAHYHSDKIDAQAYGTLVRGTSFSVTPIYGTAPATNSGGTINFADTDGTVKSLEIRY